MSRAPVILPPLYYRDHFVEMLDFVAKVYPSFLGEAEQSFIADFNALDLPAQCLFIRMVNRKKAVFDADDLRYGEIDNIWTALDHLKAAGFIREADARDYRPWLESLNKARLCDIARQHGLSGVRSNWSKSVLAAHIFGHVPYADLSFTTDRFVVRRKSTLSFLLYLYFGRLTDGFTAFTLRDMGIVKTKTRQSYQARFPSAADARAGFFYTQALQDLKTGADIEALFSDMANWPATETDQAASLRNALLHKVGAAFEKRNDISRALVCYAQSSAFASQERRVRILYAQGAMDEVKALLEAMLESPDHDEASLFASDFFSRKFGQKRVGIYTELLTSAESIEVDDLYRGDPELGAMSVFTKAGWRCYSTENGLWPILFALLFWEELFDGEDAYSSDFDHLPKALKDKTFTQLYASTIAQKLDLLSRGEALPTIQAQIAAHSGEHNGLFYWFDGLDRLMTELLRSAPPSGVAGVMARMAQDFHGMRDGFPDLMLCDSERLRFVEIKGEGDQIRRNQMARLKLLQGLGFEAGICRVTYRHDPDQIYVVVDVETTGGRPPNDRVTEIGAVKIQRGQVIAEWSSLINPEKHIPGFITQLTGISNDMVVDAPRLAEVADSLADFMAGAIFVAHNVNFDYGFIAAEFRRLDRRFRHPKLCTCASMRRFFPGLSAYGLANLCREFHINLKDHHRALADARAAAELLILINEKRLKGLSAA